MADEDIKKFFEEASEKFRNDDRSEEVKSKEFQENFNKFSRKRTARSAREAIKSIRKNPKDRDALRTLGSCLLQKGWAKSSAHYLERALNADSSWRNDEEDIYELLCIAYSVSGPENAERALEYHEKVGKPEDSVNLHYWKSVRLELLRRCGRNDEAIEIYHDLIRTDPEDPNLKSGLVEILMEEGKVDEARKIGDEMVRQSKGDIQVIEDYESLIGEEYIPSQERN